MECECAKCGEVREIVCRVDGEPWCEECFDKASGLIEEAKEDEHGHRTH